MFLTLKGYSFTSFCWTVQQLFNLNFTSQGFVKINKAKQVFRHDNGMKKCLPCILYPRQLLYLAWICQYTELDAELGSILFHISFFTMFLSHKVKYISVVLERESWRQRREEIEGKFEKKQSASWMKHRLC